MSDNYGYRPLFVWTFTSNGRLPTRCAEWCVVSDEMDGNGRHREFEAVIEAWAAGLTARSGHTGRSYQVAVERFIAGAGKPLPDLKLADVLFYVRDLSQSRLARATLAQHVSAIRSFLRYCRRRR